MSTPRNLVIIDTETGGLDPLKHSLISVGLVSECGTFTDEFLVKEDELSFDERSMAIHGITEDAIVSTGLTPTAATERLEAFLTKIGGTIIFVGHNISFDLAFVKRLYRKANKPLPKFISHRSIDTHSLLWLAVDAGRLPKGVCSSDGAFRHFDISPPEALRHTALADAKATQELLLRLRQVFAKDLDSK